MGLLNWHVQAALRLFGTVSAGIWILLLCNGSVRAEEIPEYKVKAAMLYKFAVFVEWPPRAFKNETAPFVVCVVGEDPFGPWLQQEMGEASIGAHPVEIRHTEPGEGEGECHMVFISASEKPRLQKILAPLRRAPALIVSDVSDVDEFCRLGGMICLVMEGAKVRFQLNSKTIAGAGLKIDSKLKRVAISADCGDK